MNIRFNDEAYTVAELIILIFIVVMSSLVTIPVIAKKTVEKQNVIKLTQVYHSLSNAFDIFMIENKCTDDIYKCTKLKYKQYGIKRTERSFAGVAKNLNVEDYICGNEAKGKKWLNTKPVKMLDGTTQKEPWEAPSLYGKDAWQTANCYYLLKNKAVIHVTYVDTKKQSGFGSIDVNGKKGPNKYGVDIFPFGIGAYNNSEHWASKSINPFWAQDGTENNQNHYYKGMCRISCPKCDCKPDKNSPTAYVLEYKKLPKF